MILGDLEIYTYMSNQESGDIEENDWDEENEDIEENWDEENDWEEENNWEEENWDDEMVAGGAWGLDMSSPNMNEWAWGSIAARSWKYHNTPYYC